jgi:hypothetical protein
MLGAFWLAPPASAAGTTIKCTAVSGNIRSGIILGGCSGNTGGGANFVIPGVFFNGGTITWANGKTTTLTMSFTETTEHDPTETLRCPTGSTELESTGTVTADTTGSAAVGGAAKSELCFPKSGSVTFEPGTVLKLK